MKFTVQIHLPSLANERMHWRDLAVIKRDQRLAVAFALAGLTLPSLPLVVTITRIGKRDLDDDNLAAACKYVRDQIADKVGVDDGSPLYTWQYRQARGSYCVEVEILPREGY